MQKVQPASPTFCFPILGLRIDQPDDEIVRHEDDILDPTLAMLGEPIVGTEWVVYDDTNGPGAMPARPLPSPQSMTAAQRAIHDLTHLPYHPGCEVCVSCRRPNNMHLSQKHSERTVPFMVGDYCFPKHSDEVDIITALIIRVYPNKLFFGCHVNARGRDPIVIHRLARFIK